MDNRDDYRFLQLRDAIASINQKVSFIGVVLEFGFARKTKGTDWFSSLKIIDETCPKGVSVNLFAESADKLPHVASPGDIIQLCHVVMKPHHGEVYALFNKKFSSFALYEGKDGHNFLPYQCSSRFHCRNQDSKFIAGLRKWLVDLRIDLDEGPNSYLFLREIREGERANLVCKILHVCNDSKNEWVALVWDGTDCPPININTKAEDKMDNQLPLQLESLSLPRDLLCTFPAVGTILPIFIEKDIEKDVLHMLNVGIWMKFCNVFFKVQAGLWCGVLTSFTKLRYMLNEDFQVSSCQRSFEERLSLKLGRIPYWSFPWCSRITEVDYDHVPFTTLMDVLTHSKVTAKFKCIVRVVAMFPWQAEDFCSAVGTYRIRLTIEDPTARIHAFVFGEDGEKFFDGYPSIHVLKRKQNKLLGVALNDYGKEIEDAPRNPPWVQCCLKSYYLNKNDLWGSRQYRIFSTKVVA